MALGLAMLALVVFVCWNFLPFYQFAYSPHSFRLNWQRDGTFATSIWPGIFSVDPYLNLMRDMTPESIGAVFGCISTFFGGLVVVFTVPFWVVFHSSAYLRIPIAIVNFLGGVVICISLLIVTADFGPTGFIGYLLLAASMVLNSASLFTFKNEFALRRARSEGRL